MEKNYLEKLHSNLVEILDYVCKVCDENNLQYFIAYGTALGAYRHQGFIPWDDDVDIALPRNDYEKLLNLLKDSNYDKYSCQNETNEKNYFLVFSKIRKNGTIFIERILR
ncbi:MAG: LicD family protein [Clostridia bacterium]|nr:LicD family protein [Clostridia bacterium]